MDIYRTYTVKGPKGRSFMLVVIPARDTTKIKDLRWEIQVWVYGRKLGPFYADSLFARTFERALVIAEEHMFKLQSGEVDYKLSQRSIETIIKKSGN